MKRLPGLLAFLSLASAPLAADAFQDGPYTYTVTNSQATITDFSESYGLPLAVTNTLGGYPVVAIGPSAFSYCAKLPSVTIADGVAAIGDSAFWNCSGLKAVTLGDSVASVGSSAFWACSGLTNVAISNGLVSIGDSAFSYCTNLPCITLPASVTNLGYRVFDNCGSLTGIVVEASSSYYRSEDGVLFDRSAAVLIQCPGGKSGAYSVPGGVAAIGEYAFAYCAGLSSVVVPASVTGMCSHAFYYCSGLTNLSLGSGLAGIGDAAFSRCYSLASIAIPDGVTALGGSVFWDCISLTNVVLGAHLAAIGDYAFSWCESLETITVPAGVTVLGSSAFSGCTGLRRVYFSGYPPACDGTLFDSAAGVTVYFVRAGIGWGAFLAGRPAVFWNPEFAGARVSAGGSGFVFRVVGSPDIPVAVEATTNLLGGAWLLLQTNRLSAGSLDISDPDFTNCPSRFYRVTGR